MATPKKKHLIELMIEAGVKWPDIAEYAAQDKHTLNVNFYRNGKPVFQSCYRQWMADDCTFMSYNGIELDSLCRNWNQAIVTREQYDEALALSCASKVVINNNTDCAVVTVAPSIEQLTAYYHAKAAEADRLQVVADDALKAADDALIALERAGELIGLVISINAKPKQVEQPAQPEITYWRDLRVGDVIEYVNGTVRSREGKQGEVCEIDENDHHNRVRVMFNENEYERFWCSNWRFIRRP